jgi:hypothetical protein
VVRKPTNTHSVSPNNPCPFLRALVDEGMLADDIEPLDKVVKTIVEVASTGEGKPKLPTKVIYGIAMIANGLGFLSLIRSMRRGVQLNALRGGPLDKKGVGSGIIDGRGAINQEEVARLQEFASQKVSAEGLSELGLGIKEIQSFMNANFKRAEGRRRRIDRALMNGEWPILLKVMGKDGPNGRYLSLTEVQELFVERRLPKRMTSQPMSTE